MMEILIRYTLTSPALEGEAFKRKIVNAVL